MAIKTFYPMTSIPGTNEQTASGQVTVTASGMSREYGSFASEPRAIFFLDVSAVSGTAPKLDVVIEGQDPASQKWIPVATFPQQTGVTTGVLEPIAVNPLYYLHLRARWTVAGTASPSFTFSIGSITSAEEPIP